jgi:formate dehydrogenase subunit delta
MPPGDHKPGDNQGGEDSMDKDVLIRLANSIGDFFEAMPDRDRAIADIADHIRKFWVPDMRREILDDLEAGRAKGLSDIVRVALTQYRSKLYPALAAHEVPS